MSFLLLLFIILNLIIPALYIWKHHLSKEGMEVDHVLLFTLGFIFYWVLPILIGKKRLFAYGRANPGMDMWYQIFNKLDDLTLAIYLMCCLLLYISFITGDMLFDRIWSRIKIKGNNLFFHEKICNIFLAIAIFAVVCFGYTLKNDFFKGYTGGTVYWKGSFIASTVLLLSVAFIYSMKVENKYGAKKSFSNLLLSRYFIIYFIASIFLVSIGARTFFLSSILMLLVYRSVYFKRIKISTFLIVITSFFLFGAIYPSIRSGHISSLQDFRKILSNLEFHIFVFFSDPILASFSLIHYFTENIPPLISYPFVLINKCFNIVPQIIFPSKGAYYLTPNDLGYIEYSPFGASNTFFTVIMHFGLIGAMFIFFMFSFILTTLKKTIHQLRTLYIMICGWIAISFFRDFDTTIVKLIFEFSILIPIVIIIISHILSVTALSVKKTALKN